MPGKRSQSKLDRKTKSDKCTDTFMRVLLLTDQGLECMWTLVVIGKAGRST